MIREVMLLDEPTSILVRLEGFFTPSPERLQVTTSDIRFPERVMWLKTNMLA